MDTPHQTLKRAQEYRTVFLDYLQIVLGTFLMALSFCCGMEGRQPAFCDSLFFGNDPAVCFYRHTAAR